MTLSGFRKAGHWPTLLAAFLYFDISFMVWVLLGPLGPFLGESLHLSATQKGFLVSVPLLAGAFFRPLLGALADTIGGRRTGLLGLVITLVPLALGFTVARSLEHLFIMGILLGVAGASFAVALPLASRWYPPEYQGLAMGIAGAGNSGTVLATLFMPRIASAFGWEKAFGIAMAPVAIVLVLFFLLAKDAPVPLRRNRWADYVALFRESDTAWFCGFYAVTFGGFVGLASFLTVFFVDQYHLSKVSAGDFTTLTVIAGSALRPLGGWVADRTGGYKVLLGVYLAVATAAGVLSTLPVLTIATSLLILIMGLLGIGNGAIFQMVPQRFSRQVGIMTGLVGAAGGIGGFFLPSLLGGLRDVTGSYGTGIAVFACLTAGAFATLLLLGPVWMRLWPSTAVDRAGLFSWKDRATVRTVSSV